MASRRSSVVASALGVAAGLGAVLPPAFCPGGSCASCFACLGVGSAAAVALLAGAVLRPRGDNGASGHTGPPVNRHRGAP